MNGFPTLFAPATFFVALAVAMFVFGLLPGLSAKLLARAFPKGDPRRAEMIAEVYSVPRWERPVWVAEQVERVLTEALPARVRRSSNARLRDRTRRPQVHPVDALRGLPFGTDALGSRPKARKLVKKGLYASIAVRSGYLVIYVTRVRRDAVVGLTINPGSWSNARRGDMVTVHLEGVIEVSDRVEKLEPYVRRLTRPSILRR